jgi:amyloid beta precursor protein binding protein 1
MVKTEQLHETMASEEKLDQYTIFLIVSPIDHIFWNEIGVKHCNQTKKPLINILSIGFYSHFSISYPSTFPIVDTHPDPATVSDLRLLKPWKELQEYAAKKTEHLDSMNDHDHGHVPWLLLILHYLEQWKLSHDRKVPSIYKEKTAFRQFLLDHVRVSNSAGVEENFEQAAGAVLKSLNDPSPNSAVRKIWEDPQCDPSESVCNKTSRLLPLSRN